MNPWLIIGLLATHYVADFWLQSDWMALNKSKNLSALVWHSVVYSVCFVPVGMLALGLRGLLFAATLGAAHYSTDGLTSQLASRFWAKSQWYWYFKVLGTDQMLHYVQIVGFWYLLR